MNVNLHSKNTKYIQVLFGALACQNRGLTGMAPENFGGGGLSRLSSMERSIRVREMARVIQIYYIKHINFHAGGPPIPPWSRPVSRRI